MALSDWICSHPGEWWLDLRKRDFYEKGDLERIDQVDLATNWMREGNGVARINHGLNRWWSFYPGCICVCSFAQSCPTHFDPMNCSSPGSSVHGVFQVRILEQVAVSYFRAFSWPRDWTCISYIAGWFCTIWAIKDSKFSCSAIYIYVHLSIIFPSLIQIKLRWPIAYDI